MISNKYLTKYYIAVEGRWTQTDPSGQYAHYVYASNNPVNFQDLRGYFDYALAGGGVAGCVVVGAGFSGGVPGLAFGCAIGAKSGYEAGEMIGTYVGVTVYASTWLYNNGAFDLQLRTFT